MINYFQLYNIYYLLPITAKPEGNQIELLFELSIRTNIMLMLVTFYVIDYTAYRKYP